MMDLKTTSVRRIKEHLRQTWRGITEKDVSNALGECELTQQVNPRLSAKSAAKPGSARAPFKRIQVDLDDLTVLGSESNCKYVLSVLDVFSRVLWLMPLPNKGSESVALVLETLFAKCQWGLLKILQSDNGGEFKGKVTKFCETYNLKQVIGRPHHPQSQGNVERSHKWKDLIRFVLAKDPVQFYWAEDLSHYCKLYNEKPHGSLGRSTGDRGCDFRFPFCPSVSPTHHLIHFHVSSTAL